MFMFLLDGSTSRCRNRYVGAGTYRKEFKCGALILYGDEGRVLRILVTKLKNYNFKTVYNLTNHFTLEEDFSGFNWS